MTLEKDSALTTATPVLTDKVRGIDDPGGTPISVTFTNNSLLDLINSLTAKNTLTGADKIAIIDSAASNVAKNITFTNFLASMSAASFWTTFPGTPVRASNTTFTNTGDYTSVTAYPFGKGLVIKWTESGVVKVGMISIPPTYSAPNQTNTFIGDTMSSIDAGSLKYAMINAEKQTFNVAGTLGAITTDIARAWFPQMPYRVIGADVAVGTAGTTNNTTFDINKGTPGTPTSMFTTKPTLATTVQSSPTPFTADSGISLALADKVTIDLDAFQTTSAVDGYIDLYVFPVRYLYLT